jgi:ssDNA thymidine ADP-ribosyltransferase, DarT
VVIAGGNAASDYTGFWPSPTGLAKIDKDTVPAEYWTDPDPILKLHKTRVKCAEVLVPDRVDPHLIRGFYVSSPEVESTLKQGGFKLPITIDAHMFFR